ncbi:hypothetical protein B0T22DRAFT_450490 [Podospora appendiculata]|uniref:lipoyl(octanoyl) transferase n=1 Tax=Podospora appendiculata TaxID=314037 RepID=A0AAE0XI36_9PEZI|nr:hypothetical protein B0T22DRAFT_450490 [Podospora appendiculata]
MRLRHLHLPSRAPSLYPPYALASRVQEHLRRQQLDFKDSSSSSGHHETQPPPPSPPAAPPPTLLSFTPLPTYTLGRRQTAPLTAQETARLQAPLHHYHHQTPPPSSPNTTTPPPLPVSILNSPRGGLTTYHGPGQTVLWPVLDLRSPYHKQYKVRCYSRLLEETTIATLASQFGLAAFTTADPGVWVRQADQGDEQAKIAALGVHLRRHVSALGTAINVAMPGAAVVDERCNPWARIVACGLEGRTVTSVAGQVAPPPCGAVLDERAVAEAWAAELAVRIGVDGVEMVGVDEVVALLERLLEGSAGQVGEEGVGQGEREYVAAIRRLGTV